MSDARVMRAFRYLVNDCKRSVSLRDVEGALERADRYEAKPDYRKRAAGAYIIKGDATRPPRSAGEAKPEPVERVPRVDRYMVCSTHGHRPMSDRGWCKASYGLGLCGRRLSEPDRENT